jgi:pyruvate ferredoxin oxidoreductase gamma subunit
VAVTVDDERRRDLLPGAGADGFFGIRLESIGGLGAHLAGQILAEAGVLGQGLNGSHFSSYGSEKKGSPVKSFVRFCASDRPIRASDPVERPQVVAVFHEALVGALDVAAGLTPSGAIVVNSARAPEELREELGLPGGTVATLDALRIAVEEGTRVNTAMLGAIVRLSPLLDREAVRATIAAKLGKRYPQVVEANLRTFERGHEELRPQTLRPADVPVAPVTRPAPAIGYLEAPVGGTILEPASTVVKNLTSSRQGFLPAYDVDTCVHCGICDLVCPDLCLVWEEEPDGAVRLRGIDYHYCKGCLKCTEACPTGSLSELREEEGWAEAHRVPLFPELEAAGGTR